LNQQGYESGSLGGKKSVWQPNVQRPIKSSGKPNDWRRSQSVVLNREQAQEKYANPSVEPLNPSANLAQETWDKNPLR
jgi:hypothetical protein